MRKKNIFIFITITILLLSGCAPRSHEPTKKESIEASSDEIGSLAIDFTDSHVVEVEGIGIKVTIPNHFKSIEHSEYQDESANLFTYGVDADGSVLTAFYFDAIQGTELSMHTQLIRDNDRYSQGDNKLLESIIIEGKQYFASSLSMVSNDGSDFEANQLFTLYNNKVLAFDINTPDSSSLDGQKFILDFISKISYKEVEYRPYTGLRLKYPGKYDAVSSMDSLDVFVGESPIYTLNIFDISNDNNAPKIADFLTALTNGRDNFKEVEFGDNDWLLVPYETHNSYIIMNKSFIYECKIPSKNSAYKNEVAYSIMESVGFDGFSDLLNLSKWLLHSNESLSLYYPNESKASFEKEAGSISVFDGEVVFNYSIYNTEDSLTEFHKESSPYDENVKTENTTIILSNGVALPAIIISGVDANEKEYVSLKAVNQSKGYVFSFISNNPIVGIRKEIMSQIFTNLTIKDNSLVLSELDYLTFEHELFSVKYPNNLSFVGVDGDESYGSSGMLSLADFAKVSYIVRYGDSNTLDKMKLEFADKGYILEDFSLKNNSETHGIKATLSSPSEISELIIVERAGFYIIFMLSSNETSETVADVWEKMLNSFTIK